MINEKYVKKLDIGFGPLGKPMVKVPFPNSPMSGRFNPPSVLAPKKQVIQQPGTIEVWYVEFIEDDGHGQTQSKRSFVIEEPTDKITSEDLGIVSFKVLWHGPIDIKLWELLKDN